jgi:predicted nucleic acid-binding protein
VDADCLIAGTLTPSGATSLMLDLWREGAFELVVCPTLIEEVRKALLHPRIAGRYGIPKAEAEALASTLAEEGILFEDPIDPPRVVPDDPNDDYLVALARAARAEILVTRDRHFRKVEVEGLPILSPGDFVHSVLGA